MPEDVRKDVERRLHEYLIDLPGYHTPKYVDSGGSAAIYRVESPTGTRAIKVYAPAFLEGELAAGTRRRLDIQRSLIGHDCPSLVDMFRVDEAKGSAFVEMEFVEWPQLKRCLDRVPDECVSALIRELVATVQFLESRGVVHRDIKPENIHISHDFKNLKLIDLGVAREIAVAGEDDPSATDHGSKRRFISTAQYSSPEYLFRLDAPSSDLWRGLNIYQVGAVLHDLINKRPLFQDEVDAENRWLIARAVLTKTPTFLDHDPLRLSPYKALALRCLSKILDTRLAMVTWTDFDIGASSNSIETLRAKLAKKSVASGDLVARVADDQLAFEREDCARRIFSQLRTDLVQICAKIIPITCSGVRPGEPLTISFQVSESFRAESEIHLSWHSGVNIRSATAYVSSTLVLGNETYREAKRRPVMDFAIGLNEEIVASAIAQFLASDINHALDLCAAGHDPAHIHGIDLGDKEGA